MAAGSYIWAGGSGHGREDVLCCLGAVWNSVFFSLRDESLFSLGVSGDCVLSLWLRRIDQSTQTDVTQLCLRNRKPGPLSTEDQRAEVPASSLHRLSMAPELRSHADGNGSPHKHEANEEDA